MARRKVETPELDVQPSLPDGSAKVELKGVVLKGWGNREGRHTIYVNGKVFTFVNGKAKLPERLANELKDAGYVE